MFLLPKKKNENILARKLVADDFGLIDVYQYVLMSNGGRVGPENPQNQVFWLEKFNKYCIDDRWWRVRPKTL